MNRKHSGATAGKSKCGPVATGKTPTRLDPTFEGMGPSNSGGLAGIARTTQPDQFAMLVPRLELSKESRRRRDLEHALEQVQSMLSALQQLIGHVIRRSYDE